MYTLIVSNMDDPSPDYAIVSIFSIVITFITSGATTRPLQLLYTQPVRVLTEEPNIFFTFSKHLLTDWSNTFIMSAPINESGIQFSCGNLPLSLVGSSLRSMRASTNGL